MRWADPWFQKAVRLCLACAFLMGMAHAADSDLKLLLYNPLVVDGSATTASTMLQLRNSGASRLNYRLTIKNAVSRNTCKAADWGVNFYGPDGKPVGPILEGTLAPNKLSAIRVDLSNVFEAGETTADLMNNEVKVGSLKLVKDRGLPFKVSLEGNPPEKPEIEFVKGVPLTLHWKNDDPMCYPLSWEFSIKGSSVTGTTTVGPDGSKEFSLTPNDAWFSWWDSLFKSETVDGTVRVRYQPNGGYPSKTLPIKARLSSSRTGIRDVWSTILILAILAAGALFSSYVKVDLVNRIKAIFIKRRVNQLARILGESQPQLSSPSRVSLWLERDRILATLPHGVFFTPETTATLAQSYADTDALKQRVDLAQQIADACIRLDHVIDDGTFPPTLAERTLKYLQSAQDVLKKSALSAAELERISTLLGRAINTIELTEETEEDLKKILDERMQRINARFTDPFKQDRTCVAIKARVPIPFMYLDANMAQAASQADRDANTRKLLVIADMVAMGSTDDGILGCLQRQDFVSLQRAEQLLTELKEGVSPATLTAEIVADPPRVYITVDRDTVRVNTPMMMKLRFDNPLYNRAAARRRIEATWSFGHQNVNQNVVLTEKGWEIYHYFPKPETYKVRTTFTIDKVEIHPAEISYDVPVSPQKTEGYSHTAVEAQRWLAGLLIAILGLFAVAKDKILSFDTTGIIIAVFLLGFGVDLAKNFLVSQAEGKTEAKT